MYRNGYRLINDSSAATRRLYELRHSRCRRPFSYVGAVACVISTASFDGGLFPRKKTGCSRHHFSTLAVVDNLTRHEVTNKCARRISLTCHRWTSPTNRESYYATHAYAWSAIIFWSRSFFFSERRFPGSPQRTQPSFSRGRKWTICEMAVSLITPQGRI